MILTDSQIKIMQEQLLSELTQLLMTEWHYSLEQSLSIIYNTDTFDRLMDKSSGLYYQSVGYVYSFLDDELRFGVCK